jgi:hypothetical protein
MRRVSAIEFFGLQKLSESEREEKYRAACAIVIKTEQKGLSPTIPTPTEPVRFTAPPPEGELDISLLKFN